LGKEHTATAIFPVTHDDGADFMVFSLTVYGDLNLTVFIGGESAQQPIK